MSDKKIPVEDNGRVVSYEPELRSVSDYAPFGMQMVGRKWQAGGYRYGFNGKENDNEVKGEGNQQDYGMRIYDPRLGRFLSVDPLVNDYPWYTPYQFTGNSPIAFVDPDGRERLYFVYTLVNKKPVYSRMITQSNEPTSWQSFKDDFKKQYFNSNWPIIDRKAEYSGDLITDCAEIFVLEAGSLYTEFDSYSAMIRSPEETMERARAESVERTTNMTFYGEMAMQYYSMPSDFFGAAGGSDYFDPNLDNKFGKYHPEARADLFPRLDGIKVTETVPKEYTVAGQKSLDVGLGELSNGTLALAIYMKGANGEYLLKKGTVNGAQIFEKIYSKVQASGGVINVIQGNWSGTSDNLTTFNSLILNGMRPEAAALKTFTGTQAGMRGYKNVTIDKTKSKLNPDGMTYENATINFSR